MVVSTRTGASAERGRVGYAGITDKFQRRILFQLLLNGFTELRNRHGHQFDGLDEFLGDYLLLR